MDFYLCEPVEDDYPDYDNMVSAVIYAESEEQALRIFRDYDGAPGCRHKAIKLEPTEAGLVHDHVRHG